MSERIGLVLDRDVDRFQKLVKLVDKAVEHLSKIGIPGKSYEGSWRISYVIPNTYCRNQELPSWEIRLNCYLIGPSRHYEWSGINLSKCLDMVEEDVTEWCREAMMMEDETDDQTVL